MGGGSVDLTQERSLKTNVIDRHRSSKDWNDGRRKRGNVDCGMRALAKLGLENDHILHSLVPDGRSGSMIDGVAFGNSRIHVFGYKVTVRNNWSVQTITNDGIFLDIRSAIGVSAHRTVPRSKVVSASQMGLHVRESLSVEHLVVTQA